MGAASRNHRYQFRSNDRLAGIELSRDWTLAVWRESRGEDWDVGKPERSCQPTCDAPRFVLDRATVSAQQNQAKGRTVGRPGLLRESGIRRQLAHRAHGVRVREPLQFGVRVVQPGGHAWRGSALCADTEVLCEECGDGWQPGPVPPGSYRFSFRDSRYTEFPFRGWLSCESIGRRRRSAGQRQAVSGSLQI